MEVRFNKDRDKEFMSVLRKRVRQHFKENNISKNANAEMVTKTVIMVSLYFIPYLFMMTGIISSPPMILVTYITMGIAIGGIGLAVMHDANHGAYSSNAKTNKTVGYILNCIGGSSANWRIQHNILHHSFTNIKDKDEDIKPGPLLRFSPFENLHFYHKYQHIYVWFLYGFMTLIWIFLKDIVQLFRYTKLGLVKTQYNSAWGLAIEVIITKGVYFMYMLVLPMLLLPIPWESTLLNFFTMHFLAGFILACVFQPAHVMEVCDYTTPDEKGNIEHSFAVHQLRTTTNFATSNRLFTWYVGGLNHQVEHHLFPDVCHVHYPSLAKIVKKTTEEYNIPYHHEPSFVKALWLHAKMLYELGNNSKMAPKKHTGIPAIA